MELELDLEELKQEAQDLGITFGPTIGAKKLKEKIDAHYEAEEKKTAPAEESGPKQEVKAELTEKEKLAKKIRDAKAAAKKTVVVTIMDNDKRENSYTTTCTANCSNDYFDLGQRTIPLNEPVEVEQGYINTLRDVMITFHVKKPGGLSATKTIRRYSIIPSGITK